MKRVIAIRSLDSERIACNFHLKVAQEEWMLSRNLSLRKCWRMNSSLNNNSSSPLKKDATKENNKDLLLAQNSVIKDSRSKVGEPEQPLDNVASAASTSIVNSLPLTLQPYAQLARLDKVWKIFISFNY